MRIQAQCPQPVTEGTRDLWVTFVWASRFGTLLGGALSSLSVIPWVGPHAPHISCFAFSHPSPLPCTLKVPEPTRAGALTLQPGISHPCSESLPLFWGKQKNLSISSLH